MLIVFGVIFQAPILSYFLARAGILSYNAMKNFFSYAVVISFIVAAVVTPPDVITQVLLAVPLVVLYFLSMLLVKFAEGKVV